MNRYPTRARTSGRTPGTAVSVDDFYGEDELDELLQNQPPRAPPPPHAPPPPLPNSFPLFRTDRKLEQLFQQGNLSLTDWGNVTPIPLYRQKVQKHFAFSHVHGTATWMADIVFFKKDCLDLKFTQSESEVLKRYDLAYEQLVRRKNAYPVLLFLHCNSRLARAYLLPSRHHRVQDIAPCFEDMLTTFGQRFSLIITDAAPEFHVVCQALGLQHIPLNMSSPENYHTMLAPLDRFCKTLRDMFFNLRRQGVQVSLRQDLIDRCCDLYNNVNHLTLTKVLGFDCTPWQCFTTEEVETEFIRRLTARNYNRITDDLYPGQKVYIYQPRETFKKRRNNVLDDAYVVRDFRNGRYVLENTTNPLDRRAHVRSWIVK